MRTPNRGIADRHEFAHAWRRMHAFLPPDNWPETMLRLFLGPNTLGYRERLQLITFLVGNGYPVDAIRIVVAPRLRTPRSRHHADTVLADLASSRYDDRWHYFNVVQADELYLNGRAYGEPRGSQVYTRRVNAWDDVCWKVRFPSLARQREFGL